MAGREYNKEFRRVMDLELRAAEERLDSLGFQKNSWQKLLTKIDLDAGVRAVVFDPDGVEEFGYNLRSGLTPSGPEEKKEIAYTAFAWARVAVLAHLAKNCRDKRRTFAIGYSLSRALSLTQRPLLIKEQMRKISSKGGKSRREKIGLPRLIAKTFLAKNPKAKPWDLITLIRSRSGDALLTLLDLPPHNFKIQTVDLTNERIEYSLDDVGANLSFRRIENIFSDLRRKS